MEAQNFIASKRLKGKSYALAAEKKEQEKKPKAKASLQKEHFPAKPTRAGKTPEVIISTSNSKKRKVEETDDSSDGEVSRPKREGTRKAIVIDSDDDAEGDDGSDYEDNGVTDEPEEKPTPSEDEDDLPSVKKSRTSRSKPTPPPSSSEENSGIEISDEEEEEEKPQKRKSNLKAISNKGKAKASTSSSKSDDDSMDVDEPLSSSSEKSGGKKRKAASTKDAPVKKQKRREDTDPWRLESVAVRRDWKQMKSPPLEIFHFARIVVDEYTYLTGKVHSMVTKLTADRRWVLSGTPPIHDFGAVKTIAAHLNLHLGINDDGEGQSAMIKKRIREQTSTF